MTLESALLIAVSSLTAALVALFYLYVRQRDTDDRKYQAFFAQMVPLLTELKTVATDMNTLVRQLPFRMPREGS